MQVNQHDLPAIRALMEKAQVFEHRVREAQQDWLKRKEEVRQFIVHHYSIDIEAGDWVLDLETGELTNE